MLDINQALNNERANHHDPDGHYLGLERWSLRGTHRAAALEETDFDEDHWHVIYALRDKYRQFVPDWAARNITRELERELAPNSGLCFIYSLLPRGPLKQGCHIAGLPLPHGTGNRSFGSIH
jgi:TusE/DsrC/DsvC family sulfur relay protein